MAISCKGQLLKRTDSCWPNDGDTARLRFSHQEAGLVLGHALCNDCDALDLKGGEGGGINIKLSFG